MSDQKPPDDIYQKLNIFRPVCDRDARKKHPCPDCFSCQFCSDERCAICLAGQGKRCCRSCTPPTPAGDAPPPGKDDPK